MNSETGHGSIVLVALDGSPAAATAIPLARAVAAQLDAVLEVLFIGERPASAERLRAHLGLTAYTTTDIALRTDVGDPAEILLRRAADPRVAVVVLTTHGREVEGGDRLGRVAEQVAAYTEQPILLVRPEVASRWEQDGRGLRRLLLPMDGTPTTAAVLRPATKLCGLLRATIDLLYVSTPDVHAPGEPGSLGAPRYVDAPQHEWPQWANEVLDRLLTNCAFCPSDVEVHAYLARGDAGQGIVRFATAHGHDAIVVARRSRLEPGRAATLRRILREAPCPILLVGTDEHASPEARDIAEAEANLPEANLAG